MEVLGNSKGNKGDEDFLNETLDWLNQNQDRIKVNEGNLYHVEIKPKEHELLDWDKPLSEQDTHIQYALKKFGFDKDQHRDVQGDQLYYGLSHLLAKGEKRISPESTFHDALSVKDEPKASQALHESGIPGIKYLDARSRNLPDPVKVQAKIDELSKLNTNDAIERIHQLESSLQPTYNYVIFHPDNLRVVGKNGEPIENYLKDIK